MKPGDEPGFLDRKGEQMKKYRVIFPSYDWDDVVYVNQIIQAPKFIGAQTMGFKSGVPQEALKNSDAAIKRWIDEQMVGCSCLVLFQGERTYQSRWVAYEMQKAYEEDMGRFVVKLDGMKNPWGGFSQPGLDPYKAHNRYSYEPNNNGYIIRHYSWIYDNGHDNFADWIEEACSRTSKYA